MQPFFTKDPSATLDYVADWSDWLEHGNGAVLNSVTHTVKFEGSNAALGPSDLQIEEQDYDDAKTVVWLSGGVVGCSYLVTVHVTDNNQPTQREDDRSFLVMIEER